MKYFYQVPTKYHDPLLCDYVSCTNVTYIRRTIVLVTNTHNVKVKTICWTLMVIYLTKKFKQVK